MLTNALPAHNKLANMAGCCQSSPPQAGIHRNSTFATNASCAQLPTACCIFQSCLDSTLALIGGIEAIFVDLH